MRIVRTAGMLLLTIGLPVLLVVGALWTATQHGDEGGALSGRVERITTAGHAVAGTGAAAWASSEVRGRPLALVVMLPDASAGVDLRVEVRPGRLALATWGLLVAGAVLILLGMATLARPTRGRSATRHAALADVLPQPVSPPAPATDRPRPGWAAPTPMPVQPILAWPPHPSLVVTPAPLPVSGPVPAAPAEPQPADYRPVGPGLPGSADLATALGALGSPPRAARRRRTAGGLPAVPAAPPSVYRPPGRRTLD
jgi:hypothetical protein